MQNTKLLYPLQWRELQLTVDIFKFDRLI